MSQWTQADAISAARGECDDAVDGKIIFSYSPLLGNQDGTNKIFQIPQPRIVGSFLQVFKNGVALTTPTDFTLTDAKKGIITFVTAPAITDEITVTFTYTWFDDLEFDHHLNRAANELGFDAYYTQAATVAGSETVALIDDFPNGLKGAIILLAAARACQALADRFAVKYDVSAGDQDFSPSQMAEKYETLAEKLYDRGIKARDAFYQGQGRQYRPAIGTTGFVLPNWTPKR